MNTKGLLYKFTQGFLVENMVKYRNVEVEKSVTETEIAE